MNIDFVIPWVDGGDPEWKKRRETAAVLPSSDCAEQRYRDWGLLRYWFRGVEKNAPWVHRIWLIVDQDPPEWLNLQHRKLRIVRHEDYLPGKYRPAFSSHPIELNMHRIKGLSEYFVYFNDDMFLLSPVDKQFFFRNGLPVDAALLNPIPTNDLKAGRTDARIFTCTLNNAQYLNRDYIFRDCVRTHFTKWLNLRYGKDALRNLVLLVWPRFVGFAEPHLPQAFLKRSFVEAWRQDYDILDATSRHHIRDDRDVNQWLIRYRQLAEGRFAPGRPKRGCFFSIAEDKAVMHHMIQKQKAPVICLNDDDLLTEETFLRLRKKLHNDFRMIFPEPCSYEKMRIRYEKTKRIESKGGRLNETVEQKGTYQGG